VRGRPPSKVPLAERQREYNRRDYEKKKAAGLKPLRVYVTDEDRARLNEMAAARELTQGACLAELIRGAALSGAGGQEGGEIGCAEGAAVPCQSGVEDGQGDGQREAPVCDCQRYGSG